ncbi:hypothetical protein SCHPADRAFT_893659 [Schizopora paradoxa]|uniref:Uncharacterized protein n=1 Tax=Schizopora paradoxa TaxID=27342 RepID=A0A0H2RA39_9AGAM|nr:hypothetical protein SCHPADRAFT_893659 [Schizopora paradoxa]
MASTSPSLHFGSTFHDNSLPSTKILDEHRAACKYHARRGIEMGERIDGEEVDEETRCLEGRAAILKAQETSSVEIDDEAVHLSSELSSAFWGLETQTRRFTTHLDDVAVANNTPSRPNPKKICEYLNARSFCLSRTRVYRRSGAAKRNRRRRGNETVDDICHLAMERSLHLILSFDVLAPAEILETGLRETCPADSDEEALVLVAPASTPAQSLGGNSGSEN